MTRISLAALGACTPPEITSRADNFDTFGSGFSEANDYTPRPVGAQSENDFMRFSTTGPS
ncbi:hypothetical protein OAE29_05090 [Octadecabacter sp.]|nr:hypothetical protein [Octadecabacter sp.]